MPVKRIKCRPAAFRPMFENHRRAIIERPGVVPDAVDDAVRGAWTGVPGSAKISMPRCTVRPSASGFPCGLKAGTA